MNLPFSAMIAIGRFVPVADFSPLTRMNERPFSGNGTGSSNVPFDEEKRSAYPTAGRAKEATLQFGAMFHLHSTKKLLDRIKPEICPPGESDTALGNWYATALIWKPQVALLVSEKTLLPVLMSLAPAATLGRRIPVQLGLVLREHGIPADFIAQEVWRMNEVRYAKTSNRSVVGILSEFSRQAEFWLAAYGYEKGDVADLLAISAKLAETPCGPLYRTPSFAG